MFGFGFKMGLNCVQRLAGEVVAPVLTAPAVITAPMWTLADSPSAGGNQLAADLLALPYDGNSPITELQWRVGAGAAQTLSGLGTGVRLLTVLAGTAADVQVRAVNAIGPTDPNAGWSDVKTQTPTVSAPSGVTVTFGDMNSATATGAIDITGLAPDGTYGAFTVAGGVLRTNAGPAVGTYTVGEVTVVVEPNLIAIADQTEFHAMTAAHYGKTALIRRGANITWAPFENGAHFGNRKDLLGMVIRGDGPDPRLTAYDAAQDVHAHFAYTRWNSIRNFKMENCFIRRTTNTGAAVANTEVSGGGVTSGLISLHRNLIVASRPDPFGDFTGGATTWPGGVGINIGYTVQGLSLVDNIVIGGNYGIRVNADWFADIIGNYVDLSYQDGIQFGTATGANYICGNLVTRTMSITTDTGGPHSDGIQMQGGTGPVIIEAGAHFDGLSRGFGRAQSLFLSTFAAGYRARIRDYVINGSTLYGYTISATNGSTIERVVDSPSSAVTTTDRNRMRFGDAGIIGGVSTLRNSILSIDSNVAAGITQTGNYDHNGGTQAALSSLFSDLTFGGNASPTLQQIFAGARPVGAAAHCAPVATWPTNAERSGYVLTGLAAPSLSFVVSDKTGTTANAVITTNTDLDPVFWALLPSGAATPTATQIMRREAAGALQYGWVDVAAGATTATVALSGLTDGTTYKVAVFQKNGYSLTSGVQSVTFVSTAVPTTVAAMLMGQSEPNAIVSPSAFYQSIPSPTITTPNLAMHTGVGTITRTVVGNAAVVAGNVNPAMSAMSVWLDFIAPGIQFEVGANCVSGTSRVPLGEDANTARNFSDLAAMVASVETAAGGPVKHLIEGWYNSDATYITNFKNNFWPLYFGSNADGSPFTLGTAAPYGSVVDHCIWDAQAASNAKGRGLFTRDDTTWHILGPMPFHDAPTVTALDNFSGNSARLSEPARANMELLVSDPIAATVRAEYGPSLHIVDFTNPYDQIHPHPNPANPAYGVVAYMWPHAIALARAAGVTIHTPKVVGIEGPTDGTYADLVVSLPNGGNLTTNAVLEGETYSGTAPHHQAVTGIEMARGSLRKPVMKTSETSYPVEFRGTVTISDAGSGSPRRGRIRVTPSTPFAFGNSLSLLRGQATASLLEPRDFDLFPWFPIEHIPALYDPTALYPFPGVAVDPYQSDLAVNVPAPAFAARGAYFGGASYFSATTGVSHVAGASGIISAYFRHGGATFTGGQVLFQQRIGSTETLRVSVTTTNRMALAIQNDSGTTTLSFYAAPGSVPFVVGQYYHLLIDWSAARGGAHILINGVEVGVRAFTLPTMNGATITQVGIGATSAAANPWLGDIGHLYINVNETLDMSVLANREKFALGGVPVNLGGNGEIPTGTAPAFYYDGVAGVDWSNKGLAGTISLTGSLTPSVPTPAY